MNYGFVKVASAIPSLKVADCTYNIQQIESLIVQAQGKGVEIIVFPELCISGYTCGDLFGQQLLLEKCEESLFKLLDFTRSLEIITLVGMPVMVGGLLMNCAVVVQGGKILGVVPKTYLPKYPSATTCFSIPRRPLSVLKSAKTSGHHYRPAASWH